MLKILSFFVFFIYVSSESKWSDICLSNSCSTFLSMCNTCYGERQCIACITSLRPECETCAENIYDKENVVSINEIEYTLCHNHDDYNQKLCHFNCRGKFLPTGQCNQIENQLVCECLSDINATTLSTLTTFTTTNLPLLVMTSNLNYSFPATISSPKIKGLLNGDLAIGFSNISIIDLSTGEKKFELKGHTQPIDSLGVLSNGNLVSASYKELTIKVWDLNGNQAIKTFSYATKYFAVLKNNDLLITQNRALIILDYSSTKIKQTLVGHNELINCVTVLDDNLVASGSNDKIVKVWNLNNGSLIQDLISHTDSVYTLAVLQNGNLVSGSADNTIKIWTKNSWELLTTLSGHTYPVIGLAVLNNGLLTSFSDDKTLKVWDLSRETYVINKRMKTIFGIDALINGDLALANYDQVFTWSFN